MTTKTAPGTHTLARRVLEQFEGDWDAAKKEIYDIADRDPALLRHFAMVGISEVVQEVARNRRSEILRKMPAPLAKGVSGESLADNSGFQTLAAMTLMNYPLAGGLRLGDATKSDVMDAADFQAMMEREAGHRKRWFALIAKKLNGSKTVRDQFKETDLRKLWEQAESA